MSRRNLSHVTPQSVTCHNISVTCHNISVTCHNISVTCHNISVTCHNISVTCHNISVTHRTHQSHTNSVYHNTIYNTSLEIIPTFLISTISNMREIQSIILSFLLLRFRSCYETPLIILYIMVTCHIAIGHMSHAYRIQTPFTITPFATHFIYHSYFSHFYYFSYERNSINNSIFSIIEISLML
jgi:hypothetical protein